MFFFPFITGIVTLCVGIATLWLNPRRPINRVLGAVCFSGVILFTVQLTAKFEGARYLADGTGNPLFWIRIKFAVVALISPMLIWLCYYVVSGRYKDRRDLWRKMLPWIGLSLVLACLPFTEGFKPSDSLPGKERYGPLYPLYFGPIAIEQIAVCIASMVVARKLSGVRRLEFAFIALALGYCSLAAIVVELMFATWPSSLLHWISRISSYVLWLVFCVSAWSVTSHRVYHSQQVLLSIGQRILVLGPAALVAIYLVERVQRYEPNRYAEGTVIAAAMLFFYFLDDKLRGRLKLKSEQKTADVAQQLRSVANRQSSPEVLIKQLELVLRGFAEAEVKILVLEADDYGPGKETIPAVLLSDAELLSEGWYSLVGRSRVGIPGIDRLYHILHERKWSALVFPDWVQTYPTLVLALGERENGLPFTYPELRVFRDLTNIVDSLYTRSRLALQVRQGEQLGAIGKLGVSIVHELRNPMWTLKSFSQLLPERIHDREFLTNFASIVPQETDRIEALAEQLLDLARPRQYHLIETDVHDVIEQTVLFTRPQVAEIGATLSTQLEATHAASLVDKNAIRQVLLNLIRNASQALHRDSRKQEKRIELRTLNRGDQLVIEVADNGPGIAPEIRKKLFSAFASSEKQGGLGIGLAICREIVAVHAGSISADDIPGGGTVFRVVLPIKATDHSTNRHRVLSSESRAERVE